MIKSAQPILFKTASTAEEFIHGRHLFIQYANSLDVDLSFQDFQNELENIDIQYNKPKGSLLLAYKDKIAIGCAGIRKLDEDIAELKRMFVDPGHRKFRVGRKLLELAIDVARELNYNFIRLDTLPTMIKAQDLYRSFGFYEIPPYRFNPVAGTVFMEMKLV
jgi:GNAT superfamily N-acetyltransferase